MVEKAALLFYFLIKTSVVSFLFFFILFGLEFSFKLILVRLMQDSEECVT